MKKNIFFLLLFFLLVLITYGSVKAFDDGIVGLTRKGGNTEGCSCHSLTPFSNVKVSIVGPSSVGAGDTVEYKLKISGGPLVRAGCDIATSNGLVILSPADTMLQSLQATSTSFELTHIWPKLPVNDTVTFIFKYVAPNTPGIFDTLFANGNSVNFNGANDSAQWNYANNTAILITNSVGIRNISSIAKDFHLKQNYPNPFNPATKIIFEIPLSKGGQRGLYTTLKIYDITGKEIAMLVNGQLKPGSYEINFNADKYGLSTGVYFYKLSSGNFTETKKMLMIK
ncbi:MAG TPA: choice-of-anchor V domain-containing protein [Ignavibacteria bacterium]